MHTAPGHLAELQRFLLANPPPVDVVVNRVYLVPCVVPIHGCGYWSPKGVPVLGPLHEDREIIDFRPWHCHVDSRFLNPSGVCPVQVLSRPLVIPDGSIPVFRVRRLRARRSQPFRWPRVQFSGPLETAHAICRVVDGHCPHQGLPLSAGHHLSDGSVVCAGHGLRWARDGGLLRSVN